MASFEEALRHNFIVRSTRLMNELNTFVYVNGRPDHIKGQHDDLIMAMAMAIYVGENSFTKLEKVTDQTKAMMESWLVNETPVKNSSKEFNPGLPVMPAINTITIDELMVTLKKIMRITVGYLEVIVDNL